MRDALSSSSDRRILEFDPDDIFGVRRALVFLPQGDWDDFFARWTAIGESCSYDLASIRADVVDEAEGWRDIDDALEQAWGTVSAAMSLYLAWRAEWVPSASVADDHIRQ